MALCLGAVQDYSCPSGPGEDLLTLCIIMRITMQALQFEGGTHIVASGALATLSGTAALLGPLFSMLHPWTSRSVHCTCSDGC